MIKNSGFLISLSGIDGCGKSSIALALRDYFGSRDGIDCKIVWCKFGNSPLNNPQIIRFVKRFLSKNEKSSRVSEERQTNNSTMQVRRIYRNILLLNHSVEIFLNIHIPLTLGKTVICDRYIFDSMVDLQQEIGCTRSRAEKVFSSNLIPKPNYKFLLDLPAESAFQRKKDTESEDYLIERRRMYLEIAQSHDLHIIDSNQSFERVLQQVLEFIGSNSLLGNSS